MARKTRKKTERQLAAERRKLQFNEVCGPSGRCTFKRPGGKHRIANYPGFNYTTPAEPCPTDRATCPVQLLFKEGQAYLRFCRFKPNKKTVTGEHKTSDYVKGRGPGDKGYLVKVDSEREAARVAKAACECWANAPDGFYQTIKTLSEDGKVKKVKKRWRGSFETCAATKNAPLGRLKPSKKTKKTKKRKTRKRRAS